MDIRDLVSDSFAAEHAPRRFPLTPPSGGRRRHGV